MTASSLDLSPLGHAALAVTLQCLIGLTSGAWVAGGALGCCWFIAREHTQAEYRWIALYGSGQRASMPWWGGFDYRVWNVGSVMDWLIPVLACVCTGLISG